MPSPNSTNRKATKRPSPPALESRKPQKAEDLRKQVQRNLVEFSVGELHAVFDFMEKMRGRKDDEFVVTISSPKKITDVDALKRNGVILIETPSTPVKSGWTKSATFSFREVENTITVSASDKKVVKEQIARRFQSAIGAIYPKIGSHVVVLPDVSINEVIGSSTNVVAPIDTADIDLARLDRENLDRFFEWRNSILNDALNIADVMKLLRISTRSGIKRRIDRKSLLAIKDGAVYRFPQWQFDPHSSDGVVPGLADVLKVIRVEPLETAAWLSKPHPGFEGKRPIDLLKSRHVDKVVDEAEGLGVR